MYTCHIAYGSVACGTDSAGQEQQMTQPTGMTEKEDRSEEPISLVAQLMRVPHRHPPQFPYQ